MKKSSSLIIIGGLALFLCGCKKDSNEPSIIGKWNIVSDSTYVGVGLSNVPFDYGGQPGDYYDFNFNGVVYINEAKVLDTSAYSLISSSQIVINSFEGGATSNIKTFTTHNLVIESPLLLTPGGIF